MKSTKKWDAPLAPGARREAVGELARHDGLLAFDICANLAQAHPEAEANMIVGIHGVLSSRRRRRLGRDRFLGECESIHGDFVAELDTGTDEGRIVEDSLGQAVGVG
jgi:hypothetical protein